MAGTWRAPTVRRVFFLSLMRRLSYSARWEKYIYANYRTAKVDLCASLPPPHITQRAFFFPLSHQFFLSIAHFTCAVVPFLLNFVCVYFIMMMICTSNVYFFAAHRMQNQILNYCMCTLSAAFYSIFWIQVISQVV